MKKILFLLATAVFSLSLMAQVTTVNESFETWPAEDWNTYVFEEGNGWLSSSLWGENQGYGNGNCAKHAIENDATDNWLVSPQVNITTSNYELVFYELTTDIQYYTYSGVHISTTSGNPVEGGFSELSESLQVENTWVEHTVDLSSYIGEDIYIAFVFQGDNSCWTNWSVDEVSIAPSAYTDGSLTEIINPTGINPIPSEEDIIVTLHNYGSSVISDCEIEWSINGEAQTTFQTTGLNISPGFEENITIGSFNFATQDDYLISLELILADDINADNNIIEEYYYVNEPNDAAIITISPEGFLPTASNQDVLITIKNEGDQTIDWVHINWQVDEINQDDFQENDLNLPPGESVDLNIGQFNFTNGIHTIEAEINISADENLSNNSKLSTVSVNMFWESFEGTDFPPEMWRADNYPFRDYFNPVANGGEQYYFAMPDANVFGEISDTLYTPLLEIENGDMINFWVNNSAFFTSDDYLIWKDGISGEIHLISEIDSELENWDNISIDISAAAGINYIGFVNNNTGSSANSALDLISSTADIFLFDNDLGIRGLDFEDLALVNENHQFNVRVKNYGLNTVNAADYLINIVDENNNILAQQAGVSLNSWEETTIIVNHTFTDMQSKIVHAIIVSSVDQYEINNTSVAYPVYPVPADIESQDIGNNETENLMIPFNTGGSGFTLGTDDISQTIYLSEEIGTGGYLYGIHLYYNEIMAIGQNLPLQVSIGFTNLTNLADGWIPQEELQLTFDGSIELYPGVNSVFIPFDEPILYIGDENIIIQFYQYEPGWPFTGGRFYATNDQNQQIRSIYLSDVYGLNINDLPDYWGEQMEFPHATFAYQPFNELGFISGIIYNENNETLEGIKISVEGASIEVLSNEDGVYILPEMPYDTYSIIAEGYGYIVENETIIIDQPEENLDFVLEALPLVSLFGEVFGSNAPEIPLEDVIINVRGYGSHTTTTNVNGEFVFNDIYGNNEYELTFELYGYLPYIITVNIDSDDFDMGQIILIEEHISAYNVWAEPGVGQAYIEWLAPQTSEKQKLQNDNGVNSYSLTNDPYEEVWLGNYFTNSNIQTLTSVELQWDIYELNHDFLTVDILNVNGEVLVSSMPFQTMNDSIMTIDIPNITINENFYAMVHWKNNELNTDALVLDYSEGTPNTAYIKYPGESFVLLSDFLGSPSGSFIIRVNTLQEASGKSTTSALSYNIYKGLSNLIHEAPWDWEQINSEPITELNFLDEDFTGNSSNTYTYAVEAIYEEGDAEYSFSNFIDLIIGIGEADDENINVNIYPNPVSTILYIENMEAETIEIFNSFGALVYSDNNPPLNTNINVNYLSSGNYYIVLKLGDKQSIHKFIINK